MQSNLAPTCPKCDSYTKVTNTFYEQGTYEIIRQRTCRNCGHVVITRQKREQVLSTKRIEWPAKLRDSKDKVVRLVQA